MYWEAPCCSGWRPHSGSTFYVTRVEYLPVFILRYPGLLLPRNTKFGGRGLAAMGGKRLQDYSICVSAIINLWTSHFLAFLENLFKFAWNLVFQTSFTYELVTAAQDSCTCDQIVDFYNFEVSWTLSYPDYLFNLNRNWKAVFALRLLLGQPGVGGVLCSNRWTSTCLVWILVCMSQAK